MFFFCKRWIDGLVSSFLAWGNLPLSIVERRPDASHCMLLSSVEKLGSWPNVQVKQTRGWCTGVRMNDNEGGKLSVRVNDDDRGDNL